MSVFVLKLIAVISMFIDHASYVMRLAGHLPLRQIYIYGRALGRPAFVIYCFLLVNGFEKTKDRKKYLSRLILFAVVSQIPFTLAFTAGNYQGPGETLFSFDSLRAFLLLLPLFVYFLTVCGRRFDLSLCTLAAAFLFASVRLSIRGLCLFEQDDLNVFYTLAVSMAIMMSLDLLRSEERNWLHGFLILAALAVELYFVQQNADYGLLGVALITGLYLCRSRKWLQIAVAAAWCLLEYRWCFTAQSIYLLYVAGALFALLPMALYNGRLGPKMRTFFYVFYPAHLALLGLVFVALSRR